MADIVNGWVIFDLQRERYGLPIRNLRQMVLLDNVSKMVGSPSYIRGVATLRGEVFPVLDLRARLGMKSLEAEIAEMVALMAARKQDHINWLDELEASVREGRPFGLATDPRKCAFGKWYERFQTENVDFRLHLEKFDAPHRRIHQLADEVTSLVAAGRQAEAMAMIGRTKATTLALMIRLFDETGALLGKSKNEVVLVLSKAGRQIGVVVDSVSAVRDVPPESVQRISSLGTAISAEDFVGVIHTDDRTTHLIDEERLLAISPSGASA